LIFDHNSAFWVLIEKKLGLTCFLPKDDRGHLFFLKVMKQKKRKELILDCTEGKTGAPGVNLQQAQK